MRPGTKVSELTKKVGQVPRMGTVVAVRGEAVEVRWDDGHTSVVSRQGIHPTPKR